MTCVTKNCERVETTLSMVKAAQDLMTKFKGSHKITTNDIKQLRDLTSKMRKHKVDVKTAQCALANCGKEYAKMSEDNLKVLANSIDESLNSYDRFMKSKQNAISSTKSPSSKPKTMSSKKSPSSKTKTMSSKKSPSSKTKTM